ncbi:MAG: peptide chain release factor N(5)-glutamine methyltransferase [Bacteroidales bacterium]|nr:MAG: peptide chain release factor N(5)-glutamine methyltransferase [Bacteroidales bacterium]
MENHTILSLYQEVAQQLKETFPSQEIQSIQRLIFEKKLGLTLPKIFLSPNTSIKPEDADKILDIVSLLKLQKPIQYILGEADFFGLIFKVTPDVLIPRQETEELVDWIIKANNTESPSILDIGTGSGCIAISLATNIKNALITAIDISAKALSVAKGNAIMNGVAIDFFEVDILDSEIKTPNQPFDIIVSNPPYVRDSEKSLIHANVLEHEPHSSLFVCSTDPLIFYRAITLQAKKWLKNNGSIYCEINEALGGETFQLFTQQGFCDVELRKDMNGKDRMIKATWNDKGK